jgi:hypothetical protein
MPSLSLVTVGQKITAALWNALTSAVNASGSNLITATSVAGTGVSLSGPKVVASAATTISVNGCFTAAYAWYEVDFDLVTSGAATLNLTLRVAGVDAVTVYDSQRHTAINATATAAQSAGSTSWFLTVSGLIGHASGTVKLYGPAVAALTMGTLLVGATPNPLTTSAVLYTALLQHRTATAYDGFTITPSTGNVTGTITIRGIA